jgi:hypothetical protein
MKKDCDKLREFEKWYLRESKIDFKQNIKNLLSHVSVRQEDACR